MVKGHENCEGNEIGEERNGGDHDDKVGEDDEESEIGDSEINEYKEAVHKLLKFRTYKVRGPNGQLRCPFCVGMEKEEYSRLLEHAIEVAEGSTKSAKKRASHFALAKYLVIDLGSELEGLPPSAMKLLRNLSREIDSGREKLDRLQSKYEEKTASIHKILGERDETHHTLFKEARKLLSIAMNQSKRILEQQEMLSFDFERKRQRLNSRDDELTRRQLDFLLEQRKMDVLVRQKNKLNVLYKWHRAKDRLTNDELVKTDEELVKGLEGMPSDCCVEIGVKRRPELDEKAFMNSKGVLPHDAESVAELRSSWIEKMKDPEWHPFRIVEDDKGNPQRLLNEKDRVLLSLKLECGDEIYNAFVAALQDNAYGSFTDKELWNFKEDRKATQCEVIRHIFTQWKALQCKRDEISKVLDSFLLLKQGPT